MKIKRKMPMYIAVQLESGNNRVWLPLPASKRKFASAIEKIGGSNGDFIISEYNCRVPAIGRGLLMDTPLSVVNHLAARLNGLTDEEILKLCVISDSDCYFIHVGQFIDYTFRTSFYKVLPGVTDEEKLGARFIAIPKQHADDDAIKQLTDHRAIGRKLSIREMGVFTPFGYLTSEIGWDLLPTIRRIPAHLDLKGFLGEEIYGNRQDCDE